MGEIVPFRPRSQIDAMVRRTRIEMLEEASAAIDRIVGSGCFHERTMLRGFPPMQRRVCFDCQKDLGEANGEFR